MKPVNWRTAFDSVLRVALLFGVSQCGTSLPAADLDFFETKIRPIFVEHCYACHSAEKKQHGNLLLDTKQGTLKGGDSGPAVVPGDLGKSLLLQAVKRLDGLEMPPERKLTEAQIDDLETWIKDGAPDPRTGSSALTKIEQHLAASATHWSFQPIVDPRPASLDKLIGAAGPQADKRVLIRRAYFDLVGVPPTFAEVEAFRSDDSPQAFEKVVDRLLADPRYGERWGRHWLDVARYADNMGSIYNGDDTYPNAFTYRDYVIRAFNDDKPYDRFVLEQIAADRLDTAGDVETLAGLGFLGLGRRKDRKLDDDTLDDTIDVIGRGLMGLSIGCARCHDHKLEPIPTQDYYGLYAVLKSSKEPEVQPALPQPDGPEVRKYAEKNRQARLEYAAGSLRAASRATAYLRNHTGDYLRIAHESDWKSIYENKQAKDRLDKLKLPTDPNNALAANGKAWLAARPDVFGPFLEFTTKSKLDPAPALNPLVARAFAKPVENLDDLARRYNELFATVDAAWRKQIGAELDKPVTLTSQELDLDVKQLQPLLIARLDVIEAEHPLPDADAESLRQALVGKGSPLKIPADRFATARLFREEDKKEFTKHGLSITDLAVKHPGAPVRAMTFVDAEKMYDGKVFLRGNPLTPGPDAPRQFLTVLKRISPEPFPKDSSGRLEFARAVASRENPLTARVIVNRVWGWHFGDPIVATPSDFGFRGDRPTNQPLLDHLAAWFIEQGWSFKKLHKYVMLSAAYRSAKFPLRPLELEPFRDSLLAVTGRLETRSFGKPAKINDTTRRTIYGFVDRKTLPSLYRSFDFPDPNFTAPKRSRTALTPRALILLNSPLLTDAAKSLASSLTTLHSDEVARVEELYRRVFQRLPTEQEVRRAREYLAAYPPNDLVHPESQDWQYGFGDFDAVKKQVTGFAALSSFDGKAFKGNGVSLDAMGGDPGAETKQSTVRRWVAPLDGRIDVAAELIHMDEKSEGVAARIISSRAGLLGEWTAKKSAVCTDLSRITVRKGDVLDFLVTSANGKDAGAYQWSPSIVMTTADMPAMPGMNRRWDARIDFANPKNPAKPLTAWEELCQAVLLSAEFAVLE